MAHESSRSAGGTEPGGDASLSEHRATPRDVALLDAVADVRDGLTRIERVVLFVLHETQRERGDRNVPTAMLWGRVCEHVDISPAELTSILARLGAAGQTS